MERLNLTLGKWALELIPRLGGSISACAYDGQEIMRAAPRAGAASQDILQMSCFPLVPFSNRIENGLFTFEGRQIRLPRNMGDHPHTIHGQGWRGEWEVVSQEADRAVLRYEHQAGDWPWSYEAIQEFELTPDSLAIRLSAANLADRQMPVGLGLHPYFPKGEEARLTTSVTHLWMSTSEQIPTHLVELPDGLDFSRGRKVAELDLDHCFAGWNGKARIDWPGRPYRLSMEGDQNLRHLVIYTPPDQDFFCVEGVENMNDAFNWMARGAETGVTVLSPAGSPGSSHGITTVFRVEPTGYDAG